MEAGRYSSAKLVENLINCYVGENVAFYVVLGLRFHFQEGEPNVKRELSVPCNLQTGNVHMFNGWGSCNVRLILPLFRGSVDVSTQTRTEVN
jgi:hypothetical protein